MKNQRKFFVCVIRQYGAGLYRTCVRVEEGQMSTLGSYASETAANEAMNRFLEAEREGHVKSSADITAFIQALQSDQTASQPYTSSDQLLAA